MRSITLDEAERILTENKLKFLAQAVAETNLAKDFPENGVYKQDPSPGEVAEVGSIVTITYNPLPDVVLIDMPNVEGLSLDDATKALEAAGFDASKITVETQPDDTTSPDTVLTQSPKKGEQVAPDSNISLIVSTAPTKVDVPNVVGKDFPTAEAAIKGAGLVAQRQDEVSDTVAKGDRHPHRARRGDPGGPRRHDRGRRLGRQATSDHP